VTCGCNNQLENTSHRVMHNYPTSPNPNAVCFLGHHVHDMYAYASQYARQISTTTADAHNHDFREQTSLTSLHLKALPLRSHNSCTCTANPHAHQKEQHNLCGADRVVPTARCLTVLVQPQMWPNRL
jgi:hypothetical protein